MLDYQSAPSGYQRVRLIAMNRTSFLERQKSKVLNVWIPPGEFTVESAGALISAFRETAGIDESWTVKVRPMNERKI